jgi:hypothetical protein
MDDIKHCNTCGADKPTSEFHRRKSGLQHKCKMCNNDYNRQYYRDKKDNVRKHHRTWHLKAKFGLTREAFDDLLRSQGGCGICGTADSGTRDWHVDHDHACCPGKTSCGSCVRGLLCSRCNTGAGQFEDSYQRTFAATLYLMDYEIRKAGIEL